jgi:uncharacterized RDD family membrane protein YckC
MNLATKNSKDTAMHFDQNDLASRRFRLFVSLTDWIIFFVTLVLGYITLFVPLLLMAGLSFYLYVWRGQTVAMYIFKLRVISINTGEQAAPLTMVLRMLIINLLSFVFGFFTAGFGLLLWLACMSPMFFNEKRQEVWDFLASTTVVKDAQGTYARSSASKSKSATAALADDLDLDL